MKKLVFSALAMLAVVMGFTACSSDDDFASNSEKPKLTTVYATTEQPTATRTTLGEGNETNGYPVLWTKGDKIMIGDREFTLVGEGGSSTGLFKGETPSDKPYGIFYPITYNGDPTSWPAEQTYVKDNIPQGAPMYAETIVEDGVIEPFQFMNMGGILRLTLKLNEGDESRNIKKIVVSSSLLAKDIELNCATAVELTTGGVPFHIAVPSKEYTDLKFAIYDDGGYKCVKSLGTGKTLSVQRSKITNVNLTAKSWEFFGLCFTAAEASTLSIYKNGDNLEYSLNDGEWTEWANNTPISMESGDNVYLRLITDKTWNASAESTFSMSGSLAASGNIMTLVDRTGLSKEIPYQNCFWWLFKDCTSLTSSPDLPATTLSVQCYYEMFYGCTNMTTAPELPAMTLAERCYDMMFYKCASLTTAPVLRAPTLVKFCYQKMFSGCKKINSVTCLATDISAEDCVYDWLNSAAAKGTIYVAHGMGTQWAAPSRWSVVELE